MVARITRSVETNVVVGSFRPVGQLVPGKAPYYVRTQ